MTISNTQSTTRRTWASALAFWMFLAALALCINVSGVEALVPFLTGGSDIPKLYGGYFDQQIAKQAATAVGAAISKGKTNIEVYLPSVPNLEEVRFGCVRALHFYFSWLALCYVVFRAISLHFCFRISHLLTKFHLKICKLCNA